MTDEAKSDFDLAEEMVLKRRAGGLSAAAFGREIEPIVARLVGLDDEPVTEPEPEPEPEPVADTATEEEVVPDPEADPFGEPPAGGGLDPLS